MGEMLSQDEIEALLGGMNIGGDPPSDTGDADADLSAMLAADSAADEESGAASGGFGDMEQPEELDRLTDEEKDVLGEIGNISMGTSATTLFALLGQRVMITTPRVKVIRWNDLAKGYERPCVGVRVAYTEGLKGSNVMVMRDKDVKIISNLMMGGDGSGPDTLEDVNELDLSAIAEAMNQMSGSASTSLSSLVKMRIDIDTPVAFVLDFSKDNFLEDAGLENEEMTCISFRMEIGTLIDSEIMQVVPLSFALDMVNIMKGELGYPKEDNSAMAAPPSATATAPPTSQAYAAPPPQPAPQPQYSPPPVAQAPPVYEQPQYQAPPQYAPPPPQPQYQAPPPQYYAPPPPQPQYAPPPIQAQPAQFVPFDFTEVAQQKENIGIIMEVPLEVTVELGRTSKRIREILDFAPGAIVELDKLAGEPIDVLVNGRLVAKGEVVVIDENFGVRITDTINAENRI